MSATIPIGAQARLGLRVNSNAWAGAAQMLTNWDGLRIIPGSAPGPTYEWEDDEQTPGPGRPALQYRRRIAREWADGTFAIYPQFRAIGRVLALWHGAESKSALVPGAAIAHTFEIAPDLSGIHATIGWSVGVEATEIPTAKIESLEWSWEGGKAPRLAIATFGRRAITDDSGLNRLDTIETNVTLMNDAAIRHPILLEGYASVRLAPVGGAELGLGGSYATGDAFNLSALKFTQARTHPREFAGRFPLEPRAADSIQVTGTMTVPIDNYEDFMDAIRGETELQGDALFTGSQIGATAFSERLWFRWPSLTIDPSKWRQPAGMGKTPLEVPFVCHLGSAVPTGMAVNLPSVVLYDSIDALHLNNGVA